jgi:hypothetical protein
MDFLWTFARIRPLSIRGELNVDVAPPETRSRHRPTSWTSSTLATEKRARYKESAGRNLLAYIVCHPFEIAPVSMKVAVATHSFLCRFTLDDRWQIDDFRLLNRGHHYGIALDQRRERLYAKVNDRELDALTDEYTLEFDLENPDDPLGRHTLRGWLNDVHQTAWANDGFYVANTAYNSVVYQSPETGAFDEYFFEDVRHDKNHVNSVFPWGSKVFVVLHNGGTDLDSEIAQLAHEPGEGFRLERRLRLWHGGCHNVYIDPPHLLYNASNEGCFAVVNLADQCLEEVLDFPGHTKGMAVTPEHVIIGYSDQAERHERPTSNGQLSVIERDGWQRVTDIDLNVDALPHSIGNVNEVRRLDEVDLAHRGTNSDAPDLSELRLAGRSLVERSQRQLVSFGDRLVDTFS